MAGSRKPRRVTKDAPAVVLAKKRSAKLSAARRREIARQAAHARWAGNGRNSSEVASIEEIARELTRDIPREQWADIPDDLINHLDHYVYGAPKR